MCKGRCSDAEDKLFVESNRRPPCIRPGCNPGRGLPRFQQDTRRNRSRPVAGEQPLVRRGLESTGLVVQHTSADDRHSHTDSRGQSHIQVHSLRWCLVWGRGQEGTDRRGCLRCWECRWWCLGKLCRKGPDCKDQASSIGLEGAAQAGRLQDPPCTCTWPDPPGECTWQLGDTGWERKGSVVALAEVVRISEEVALLLPDMCWHNRRSSKVPSWDNQGQALQQTSRWRGGLCTGCAREGRRLGRRGKEKDGRVRL